MRRILLVVGVSLAAAFLFICLDGTTKWFKGVRRAAIAAEITADIANYSAALTSFSNTFGFLPPGSNAVITPLLAGNNTGKMVFIFLKPQRVNAMGEFIDPTGKPYIIDVATNRFQMTQQ